MALARWGRQAGRPLQITGVDQNAAIVALARRTCQDYPEITLLCQDAFELAGQRYDYVLASQFLHHFPDEQTVDVLRFLLGLARRKVVINDLVRAPLAYAATWLFTLTTAPVFRHDGRISVRRGFRLDELARLLQHHHLTPLYLRPHFFYRFQLTLEPPASMR